MDAKKILVTGIGGNVGQGIIRNIRKSFPNQIKIVGCNITDFSAGNFLCDAFYKVPYAYDAAYIDEIKKIVHEEQIDLILPSTDYEVYYLAKYAEQIGCTLAASDEKTSEIYLDKYLSFLHHHKFGIPFASSFLPSQYRGEFSSFLVKPRKGRGSRGLQFNPKSLEGFSDEEYMVQELHSGKEITTAFYVDKSKRLHGHITLLRSLENGATSQCKVVTEYDAVITPILLAIINHSDIHGSANLQSIVTADGKIHPFEINCRISGTNSIRSNFGFEDVKYTVQEYLYNQQPEQPKITNGVAVRVLMDVIYPNIEDYNQCINNPNNYLF